MKILKKALIILSLIVLLLSLPLIAKLLTNLIDFSKIDPDKVFVWSMVRHTLQALFFLPLIWFFSKVFKVDFGFSLGNKEEGIRYLKKFILIFTIGCVIINLIMVLLGQFQPFPYDYTFKNIFGYLSFQLFFTGPSEEIIFRAFALSMFAFLVTRKRINQRLSYANLFGAIVFGLAHIGISFSPFKLTFTLPQVLFSMILGYFDGDCFEKSNSVVYPIIMHSFTNVLIVGINVILTAIL